jgi:nucleotide-binding universal stress UspA family protein
MSSIRAVSLMSAGVLERHGALITLVYMSLSPALKLRLCPGEGGAFPPYFQERVMLPVHTVLFPTDFSDPSLAAFPVACAIAHDFGARIVILYVVPPALGHDELEVRRHPSYYEGLWGLLRNVQPPDQNVHVEHRLEEGKPSTVILQVADDIKAGLIVLATHGRTGLGHLLMGSVAEQVVRKAACPVLSIRTPMAAQTTEAKRTTRHQQQPSGSATC